MTLPDTMRAMVLVGHGGPERLQWREDVPVPRPTAEEVLIRVGASAVNNTDINTRTGWYSKRVRGDTAAGAVEGYGATADADGSWSGAALRFPRIQGADCCGEIVATGASVTDERLGERVLVRALQSPDRTRSLPPDASPGALSTETFGSERDGAFAEYAVCCSHDAIAVDSALSDVELASFPCAFSTAEGMIQRAGLGAERVLITGASGGVGSAAIQLARRRGARVTAVSRSSKADALRALGADEVIERDAELPERAFDVVLDLVGGPGWETLIGALRDGGRYAVAGAIAGPIVELDLRTLYLRDLSLLGCTHQPANVFTDLVGYIEADEIRPVLAAVHSLRDLEAAQQEFLAKSHVGKIGIRIAG